MRFQTKIDWWMHLLMLSFAGGMLYFLYTCLHSYSALILGMTVIWAIITFLLFLPFYARNYYLIEGNDLYIRAGFFFKKYISITRIVTLEFTKDASLSTALSLDRIALTYRDDKDDNAYILVSPKEQVKFVTELLRQNPYIDIINGNRKKKLLLSALNGTGAAKEQGCFFKTKDHNTKHGK